jgi:RNA polymerase sigma factor (sigma-70 family)
MAASAKVPAARGEDELVRAAVAGDGQAFAELYDRHEQRVYGFCLRLLGNPADAADATQETFMRLLKRLPALDGRELNFVAYVFTAARHACYDIIQSRKRVELSGEEIEAAGPEPGAIDEDPERAALLAVTRELTEQAHARLPERQREVLALRELEGLSYEQIGEVLELKPNAVAQLISRARLKLVELVRSDALESVAGATPDCDRAMPLLARGQDRQALGGEDGNWLLMHLRNCPVCRVRESAMQEAGVSYRSLAPIVPLLWLRQATIARAAEVVGADWSEFAHARVGDRGAGHGGNGGQPASWAERNGGQPASWAERSGGQPASWAERSDGQMNGVESSGSSVAARRDTALFSLGGVGVGERLGLGSRRRRVALVLLVVCLLAFVLFVGSIARDSAVSSTRTFTPASAVPSSTPPPRVRKHAQKRVLVQREETVRRVLPSGRVVSVKVPVTSTILLPATVPSSSGAKKTAHGKARRKAAHSTPSTPPAPPLTTTTPTTTTPTTSTPTQTTPPTTSTPAPTPTTPTTTTPTTTNPNTPAPTETNPNAPPGTLNPNTPGDVARG